MSEKLEFVTLASRAGTDMGALCARIGIGRTCGYKLIGRFREEGPAGLAERSRRPRQCPAKCSSGTEAAVLKLRALHPAWGGRKIAKVLERRGCEGETRITIVSDNNFNTGLQRTLLLQFAYEN